MPRATAITAASGASTLIATSTQMCTVMDRRRHTRSSAHPGTATIRVPTSATRKIQMTSFIGPRPPRTGSRRPTP